MAELHLSGVQKIYPNGYHAIHGIDLGVVDGEFIVLVGPSGCGKSTLLNMIAGLEGITSGDISINGRVVNGVHPSKRNIAMVFQSYALYPNMTVAQNMTFGLEMHGVPKPERDKALADVAKLLQIENLLDRKPGQLSGGQRQRVAMGRAIVREPRAFLFDEPLSNLDAKLRVQMRLEIHKLQADLGTTSLYVTHDQVEAMTLGHRIVVMNAGRTEQIGTPAEVYETPATTFVAGFIGTPPMTLNNGRIASDGGAVELSGGVRLPINGAGGEPGRPVIAGVRPENIEPVAGGPIELQAEMIEVLGADQIAHLKADGIDLPARLPRQMKIAPGDRIRLAVNPSAIRLFDPESGRAL